MKKDFFEDADIISDETELPEDIDGEEDVEDEEFTAPVGKKVIHETDVKGEKKGILVSVYSKS